MSLDPFKIPAIIGSSFTGFCAEATEFYLGDKGDDNTLAADIHRDLSAGEDHKNAQYQLPNSAGGFLEDVVAVVSSTISKYEGLAMHIESDVYQHLERGQAYLSNGKYRKAYKAFQKLYKKLTKS